MHVMNKHVQSVCIRVSAMSRQKRSHHASRVSRSDRRAPHPDRDRADRGGDRGDRGTARAEARESRMCALSSCRVSYRFLNTQSTIALDLFSLSDLPLVACKLARFREGPRVLILSRRTAAQRGGDSEDASS